jgi:hypothetical protein
MAGWLGLRLFETSRQAGRIPLVLVLGECISSTRLFLNAAIAQLACVDSVVIGVKQDGLDPFHHTRLIELPRLEFSAQDSCLCCGMHGALGDALRQIFFEALKERSKRLDRVWIESNSIEPAQLAHTLRHTPFLGQRYFHQMTFRVVRPELTTDTFVLAASQWQDFMSALKALDPINNQARQFLILSLPRKHIHLEGFKAWFAQVRQDLPYKGVFYLSEEGDFGPDSLQKALGLGAN